jgi:ADP-ribose pyrophosphatase
VPPGDRNRRPIFAGRIVNLGLETATLPDGRAVELEVIRHPGAAAVVPLHDDGSVTLVHQYRHAGGGMFLELPAGVLELAEEVNLAARRFELLTALHTTPGFTDERIWIYLARGLRHAPGELDDDEYLRPVRLPLAEAVSKVEAGEITDGKTACGLLLAARRAASG